MIERYLYLPSTEAGKICLSLSSNTACFASPFCFRKAAVIFFCPPVDCIAVWNAAFSVNWLSKARVKYLDFFLEFRNFCILFYQRKICLDVQNTALHTGFR